MVNSLYKYDSFTAFPVLLIKCSLIAAFSIFQLHIVFIHDWIYMICIVVNTLFSTVEDYLKYHNLSTIIAFIYQEALDNIYSTLACRTECYHTVTPSYKAALRSIRLFTINIKRVSKSLAFLRKHDFNKKFEITKV